MGGAASCLLTGCATGIIDASFSGCTAPPMSLRSLRPIPTGFIPPCLPTATPRPPGGDQWLHEIKHDGIRVIARKQETRIKLYSRPGNDLTHSFPLIVEAPRAAACPVHASLTAKRSRAVTMASRCSS